MRLYLTKDSASGIQYSGFTINILGYSLHISKLGLICIYRKDLTQHPKVIFRY